MSDQKPSEEPGPEPRFERFLGGTGCLAGFGIAGSIIGLGAVAYGLATYYYTRIDERVSAKLRDPLFLEAVATRARPALVFDSTGAITHDMGAASLIEEVELLEVKGDYVLSFHARHQVSPRHP
ncbi:MAG TPA: hypothetical protein VMT85_12925 [Thermoanaerobaculia bacterium]|nr:hypothetical protein [Thermoanaerobaculia bacterium]